MTECDNIFYFGFENKNNDTFFMTGCDDIFYSGFENENKDILL